MNKRDALAAARSLLQTHPGVYVTLGNDGGRPTVLLWHPESGTWPCVARRQVVPSAEIIKRHAGS